MIVLLFIVTTFLLLIGSIGELFASWMEKATSKKREKNHVTEEEGVTHRL